jgi:hypothetical protein
LLGGKVQMVDIFSKTVDISAKTVDIFSKTVDIRTETVDISSKTVDIRTLIPTHRTNPKKQTDQLPLFGGRVLEHSKITYMKRVVNSLKLGSITQTVDISAKTVDIRLKTVDIRPKTVDIPAKTVDISAKTVDIHPALRTPPHQHSHPLSNFG